MAFGKAASCLILAGALWGAETKIAVRHQHLRKGCAGTLTITEDGISYSGAKKKHAWTWKYQDIQELKFAPGHLYLLSYTDSRRRLGADRGYDFIGDVPKEWYDVWKARLDQRFVAAVADPADGWSLPVKRLGRLRGSEGSLSFAPDRIVYATTAKEDSRTWRYQDIESISSSGPFQLTITTYERAIAHYGDRKGFNFQLKKSLTEAQYNQLWLDIQKKNGRIQP
jgi:hypothetical protein